MRKGTNPQKEFISEKNNYNHMVVIPVYIPHLKGYYSDSFEILKECLESLKTTVQKKTFISVVNNGSCEEVRNYLDSLYQDQFISEVIHTTNIGKVNAILKGISGHSDVLITISDADILFKKGWQEETLRIFNTFPKAGVVGLIPQFKMFTSYSSNLIFDNFLNKDLKFTNVLEPEAMKLFYKSIGWNDNYNEEYLKMHLTISKKNVTSVVGSGHAVATYRSEIFTKIKHESTNYKLGGNSENKILDESILKLDGWRLTTERNFAYHMGNTFEDWMNDILEPDFKDSSEELSEMVAPELNIDHIAYFFKYKLFKKFLKWECVNKFFLKWKGLTQTSINTY